MRLFYTRGITPALAWQSLALVVIAGIAGTYSVPARAADGDPQIFLSALAQGAATVLRDDGLNQATRTAAFRIILRRGFDVPAVSRFVLGRY